MNVEELLERNLLVIREEGYYMLELLKLVLSDQTSVSNVSEIYNDLCNHQLSNYTIFQKTIINSSKTLPNKTTLMPSIFEFSNVITVKDFGIERILLCLKFAILQIHNKNIKSDQLTDNFDFSSSISLSPKSQPNITTQTVFNKPLHSRIFMKSTPNRVNSLNLNKQNYSIQFAEISTESQDFTIKNIDKRYDKSNSKNKLKEYNIQSTLPNTVIENSYKMKPKSSSSSRTKNLRKKYNIRQNSKKYVTVSEEAVPIQLNKSVLKNDSAKSKDISYRQKTFSDDYIECKIDETSPYKSPKCNIGKSVPFKLESTRKPILSEIKTSLFTGPSYLSFSPNLSEAEGDNCVLTVKIPGRPKKKTNKIRELKNKSIVKHSQYGKSYVTFSPSKLTMGNLDESYSDEDYTPQKIKKRSFSPTENLEEQNNIQDVRSKSNPSSFYSAEDKSKSAEELFNFRADLTDKPYGKLCQNVIKNNSINRDIINVNLSPNLLTIKDQTCSVNDSDELKEKQDKEKVIDQENKKINISPLIPSQKTFAEIKTKNLISIISNTLATKSNTTKKLNKKITSSRNVLSPKTRKYMIKSHKRFKPTVKPKANIKKDKKTTYSLRNNKQIKRKLIDPNNLISPVLLNNV